MRVKATREGLIGQQTAMPGYRIDTVLPFVALPSEKALGRIVRVTNPLTGLSALAVVGDVGPHHTEDDAYVFQGARPKAESDPASNQAGIDLGERIWIALDMQDNTEVDWEFLT